MILETTLIRSTGDLSSMARDIVRVNPPFVPMAIAGIGAPMARDALDDALSRCDAQLSQRYDDYDAEDFLSEVCASKRNFIKRFGARVTTAINPMAIPPAFAARAICNTSKGFGYLRSYAAEFVARAVVFDILARDDGKYIDKYGRLARLSKILPSEPSYIAAYAGELIAARKAFNLLEPMEVIVSAEAHVFLRLGHNGCEPSTCCWRRHGQYGDSPAILAQTPKTFVVFAKRDRQVIARGIAVIDSNGHFAIGNVYPADDSQMRDSFQAIFSIAIANLFHAPLFEDFELSDMGQRAPFHDKKDACYLNCDWRAQHNLSSVPMADDIVGAAETLAGEVCDDCGDRDSTTCYREDLDRDICDSCCNNNYTLDYNGTLISSSSAVELSNGEYADGDNEIILRCRASRDRFVISYDDLRQMARAHGLTRD
jgi:hypothetical protein